MQAIRGWLAPNGKFYSCEFGYHNTLGIVLIQRYFNTEIEPYQSVDYLLDKGFAQIYDEAGVVMNCYGSEVCEYTDAQLAFFEATPLTFDQHRSISEHFDRVEKFPRAKRYRGDETLAPIY